VFLIFLRNRAFHRLTDLADDAFVDLCLQLER